MSDFFSVAKFIDIFQHSLLYVTFWLYYLTHTVTSHRLTPTKHKSVSTVTTNQSLVIMVVHHAPLHVAGCGISSIFVGLPHFQSIQQLLKAVAPHFFSTATAAKGFSAKLSVGELQTSVFVEVRSMQFRQLFESSTSVLTCVGAATWLAS